MRSRLLLIVAIIVILAGAAALWRRGQPPESATGLQRGGQITAALRGEPTSFNRIVDARYGAEIVSLLTQGRLVRINRTTFELEPWLADRWESSTDGLKHTFHLRPGVTWSDGTPLTADDVVFTLNTAVDPKVKSPMANTLTIAGQPIHATAPDPQTVVFTFAGPFGPGVRVFDNLWVLPKHKLEPALKSGTFAEAWTTKTPPSEMVGTGPFVVSRYEPGQRMVLERNPRYWRRLDGEVLPYLDRVVLEIIPDDNAQILRLESGAIDLTNNELRADDYAVAKRAADRGRLKLVELGIGPDADAFWFCQKPEAKKNDPRFAFVQQPAFRQAISHAINRVEFANTVYLGAAVPIWGPVTPGNKLWYSPDVPQYPYDPNRARELLKSIGLEDRNGNGSVEDRKGTEARFTVITQRGVTTYDRATAFLRDELAKVGITLDVAPLEFNVMIGRMLESNYDAMYYRPVTTDLDPAMTKEFWLSSGSAHFWNLAQPSPSTAWERQVDALILAQSAELDPTRRRELFNQVQRLFGEHLPVLYFVAPRLYIAHSVRMVGATPSVLRPPLLWNADPIAVARPRAGTTN